MILAAYARSLLLLVAPLLAVAARTCYKRERLTLTVWSEDPQLCASFPEHFGGARDSQHAGSTGGKQTTVAVQVLASSDVAELHFQLAKNLGITTYFFTQLSAWVPDPPPPPAAGCCKRKMVDPGGATTEAETAKKALAILGVADAEADGPAPLTPVSRAQVPLTSLEGLDKVKIELRLQGDPWELRRQLRQDRSVTRRKAATVWMVLAVAPALCCLYLLWWRREAMDGSLDVHVYAWQWSTNTNGTVAAHWWQRYNGGRNDTGHWEMSNGGPPDDWPKLLLWVSVLLCLVEAGAAGLYLGAPGTIDPIRPGFVGFVLLALADAAGSSLLWLAATQCQAGAVDLDSSFSGSFDRGLDTTFNVSGPAGVEQPLGFFCYVAFADQVVAEWQPYVMSQAHFDATLLLLCRGLAALLIVPLTHRLLRHITHDARGVGVTAVRSYAAACWVAAFLAMAAVMAGLSGALVVKIGFWFAGWSGPAAAVGWRSAELVTILQILAVAGLQYSALRLLRRSLTRQRQIHIADMYADLSLLPPAEAERRAAAITKFTSTGRIAQLKMRAKAEKERVIVKYFHRDPPDAPANMFRAYAMRPGPDGRPWVAMPNPKEERKHQKGGKESSLAPLYGETWSLKADLDKANEAKQTSAIRLFFRAVSVGILDWFGRIPYVGPRCCGSRMARKWVRLGDMAYERRAYPAAVIYFTRSLKVAAMASKFELAVVLNRLGGCYLAVGKNLEALKCFEDAVLAATEQQVTYWRISLHLHAMDLLDCQLLEFVDSAFASLLTSGVHSVCTRAVFLQFFADRHCHEPEDKDRLKRVRDRGHPSRTQTNEKGEEEPIPYSWAEVEKMLPYRYREGDEDRDHPWIDYGAELSEAHFNRGSLLLRMRSEEEDQIRSAAGQQPTLKAAIESLQIAGPLQHGLHSPAVACS